MNNIMKGISCCADCAYYSMKKHRCTRASDEGKPTDHFYADCPLPTVTKEQGWISVKDRLPEIDKSILYCAFGRSVGEGVYRGFDGRHHVWNMYAVSGTHWDNEVTRWMPLPEPPKEEEE